MSRGLSAVTAKSLLANIRFRYLGMGVFWACSMLTFRSSNMIPPHVDIPLYSSALLFVSFGFNILTMVAMSLAECRKPGTTDKLPALPFVLAAIAGLLLMYIAKKVDVPIGFFFSGAILTGIGYGYFWGSWAQTYSRLHADITSVALPLTFIVTGLIYLIVVNLVALTDVPSVVFMLPLPFISWWMLVRCRKDERYDQTPHSLRNLFVSVFSIENLLLVCSVMSFLFGLLWELSLHALPSVEQVHSTPLIFAILFVGVLFFVLTFGRRHWSMDTLLRFGAPFIVCAFALFPILFSTDPTIINTIMGVGFSVLEVLVWIACVSTAYDNRVPGVIIGTIARSTFLLFRLSGIVLGYFLIALDADDMISLTAISVLAIAALSFVIAVSARKSEPTPESLHSTAVEALLALEAEERTQEQEAAQEAAASATAESDSYAYGTHLQDYCDVIADRYNLSRREREILPYLATGRSAKYVSNELFISENTVRTHIRHIIEKTGANSKQDIIDVVFNEGREYCEVCNA